MDFIQVFIDFVLHLDKHLVELVAQYGTYIYVILFFIIFSETGFVVTPFLPGDSLLFAAGALAARENGGLDVWLMMGLLFIAAVLGNSVNYGIGSFIGPKIFSKDTRFIKREYLIKTHEFYEKYGAKAVIASRFLPIFRTFVPFVAGIGKMSWQRYTLYNVVGAAAWILSITLLGYFFGNFEIVKKNFSIVVLGIIGITVAPAAFGFLREWLKNRK